MENLFIKEETLVSNQFNNRFSKEIKIFKLQISFLKKILNKIAENNLIKKGDDQKYSILLLSALGLKSFISAFDRLSKGYLGDSESLLKRPIEILIIQAYFLKNPEKSKEYIYKNKEINRFKNRIKMSKTIDYSNINMSIFPTNEREFFQKYIYEIFYKKCNKIAHMDFEMVHLEIGLDNNNPIQFAKTLVIGPKYEEFFMKTTFNRIIMMLMFQISFISNVFNYPIKNKYNKLFDMVTDFILSK